MADSVVTCAQLPAHALPALLQRWGMTLEWVANALAIPGSYWGDEEAGLIANRLYVRADTPVHSALHETAHWICMDDARRAALHTDADGDDREENAVCYLQVLLADTLDGYGRSQILEDMDLWGYTFIAGSARAWFEHDSRDEQHWLKQHALIDAADQLTGQLRH
ncbi:hypothetical protein [Sinimarinibacterium sp. NLF-5-8]|uniref:hypothetical protein n=1 Tax=Sinimarinibacterium sp. NLF-5-8 TaxID=2698684 RepID=UPI00137BEFF8|nr:hypothetical protein [Sinimarinibacterium sp. NLF-5-8]QHS09306.1 hypothetical protein GT972_03480 [Sinimarinibacterium sp. NLF-5-8]